MGAELIAARPATAADVATWARMVHDESQGPSGRQGLSGQNGQGGPKKLRPSSTSSTSSTSSIPSTKTNLSATCNLSTTSPQSTFPEIAANAALALIAVACSLLDRQLASLERSFTEQGGFTERLHRVRTQHRKQRP